MKPITRPLTRAHLLQLTQSKDNGSSSSCNGSTVLQNIQSQVYNLAWSLNRIGDAGRVILQKENLILVGPNDVRSTIPLDLSTAADELAFWRAKLRCLEAHKSMIRLRRIKGWVYKAMTGLWRLGSDGRSVLQQAGLSFAGYGEVHYDPQPGDPETYDNLTFWETKLQHIEEEYALLKEPAKSSLHVLEFVSSGSEAEEQTEYLRAEEYIHGRQGRRRNVEAWIEASAQATRCSHSPQPVQEPALPNTASGENQAMGVKRKQPPREWDKDGRSMAKKKRLSHPQPQGPITRKRKSCDEPEIESPTPPKCRKRKQEESLAAESTSSKRNQLLWNAEIETRPAMPPSAPLLAKVNLVALLERKCEDKDEEAYTPPPLL
ncbi:hypothetical protein CFRS1_v009605 [Colletotrichum fructicola]|nr:hypothetical protein CFRS1_v009605 [Colletotrichum fructicola]